MHSFSLFYLPVILDCFIWPYRTKSRNTRLYILLYCSVYCDMFYRICWGLTQHIRRYFILPAFTQYGNIWWVILVGITLFDDVPVAYGRLKFQLHAPSFCFLTSEITTIWYRDRSVAHTLRLTNFDLEFASKGKHQRTSSYLFQ